MRCLCISRVYYCLVWHSFFTLMISFLDLVICTTPRGKSTAENAQFASKVIDLIEKLKRLNEEKHVHLHYLLEFPLCIKDQIPLHDLSLCVCSPQNVHVCNWPIPPKIPRLAGLRAKHNLSGQPQDCLNPGTSLLSPRVVVNLTSYCFCTLILALTTDYCATCTSDNTLRFLTECIVCWGYYLLLCRAGQ